MKRIVLAGLLAAGCTTTDQPPEYGAGACDATRAQALIGRKMSAETGSEALRLTGARSLRWLPPGAIVTMDFRTERLNIELDGSNMVTAIRCG